MADPGTALPEHGTAARRPAPTLLLGNGSSRDSVSGQEDSLIHPKCTCRPTKRHIRKNYYYMILGLTRHASAADIRLAYELERNRINILKAKQGGRLSRDQRDQYVEMNFAYKLLSDARTRSIYDQYGIHGVMLAEKHRSARYVLWMMASKAWRLTIYMLTFVTCFWCGCCCGCGCCCYCCCRYCCYGCCGLCVLKQGHSCEVHEEVDSVYQPHAVNATPYSSRNARSLATSRAVSRRPKVPSPRKEREMQEMRTVSATSIQTTARTDAEKSFASHTGTATRPPTDDTSKNNCESSSSRSSRSLRSLLSRKSSTSKSSKKSGKGRESSRSSTRSSKKSRKRKSAEDLKELSSGSVKTARSLRLWRRGESDKCKKIKRP